ncbi:MAG: hypothetical protein ACR2NX_03790 [Chthoniobacterales bacterium]
MIWAAGAVAAWVFLLQAESGKIETRKVLAPLIVTLLVLALLGGFYLWTICIGTGASMVGNTRLLNLAFISYEFSGIAGLGPGRLEIRQNGFEAFRALGPLRLLPMIAAAFLSLAIFLYGLRRAQSRLPSRAQIAGVLYVLPPGLLLIAVGYTRDFRLLGRHFIPLVPPVFGLMALGIVGLVSFRRRLGLAAGILLSSAWLISCLSLRFGAAHRKDDYRAAAKAAKAALMRNEIVWWSADAAAAIYYHVPLDSPPAKVGVVLIIHSTQDSLARLASPDIVIASKPDIYDGFGDPLGGFLRGHKFHPVGEVPAFTILRKAAAGPAVH